MINRGTVGWKTCGCGCAEHEAPADRRLSWKWARGFARRSGL